MVPIGGVATHFATRYTWPDGIITDVITVTRRFPGAKKLLIFLREDCHHSRKEAQRATFGPAYRLRFRS